MIIKKPKIFTIFVCVSISVLLSSQIIQYFSIAYNSRLIKSNYNECSDNIESSEKRVVEYIGGVKSEILNTINKNGVEIHARIDILDSSVDSEKKRKMLVMRVRKAIIENTQNKINIRDLNNIAIAVIDYSYQYNLQISKILAQMKIESNFDHVAVSRAGAQGLMQIMPKTMKDEIERDLGAKLNSWRIYDNIRAGCYYMSKMLYLNNNNYDDALRSYNFGYANVMRVKSGEEDFSLKRVVVDGGEEKEYLVDVHGEFILDENGNKKLITLKDRYPRETRNYVTFINKYIKIFKKYGFE